MVETRVDVSVPEKLLRINEKLMRLEDTFSRAFIDNGCSDESALTLEYRGNFLEDDSPIEREMDKLRKTYGDDISDRFGIYGTMEDGVHYLSFTSGIERIVPSVTAA